MVVNAYVVVLVPSGIFWRNPRGNVSFCDV